MRITLRLAALALLAGCPIAARAHTGHDAVFSMASGFLHPLGGVDHALAMLAVGLFAAQIGGRALWLVPLSFLTLLAGGAAAGMAGYTLPVTEAAIATSLVVLGLAVAVALRTPVALAALLAGGFAIFHGFAHGAELPQGAGFSGYAAGFLVASGLLHGAGLGIGLVAARFGDRAEAALRIGGGLIAAIGTALLFAAV